MSFNFRACPYTDWIHSSCPIHCKEVAHTDTAKRQLLSHDTRPHKCLWKASPAFVLSGACPCLRPLSCRKNSDVPVRRLAALSPTAKNYCSSQPRHCQPAKVRVLLSGHFFNYYPLIGRLEFQFQICTCLTVLSVLLLRIFIVCLA